MTRFSELMDLSSGHVVGFYQTRDEAHAIVRHSHERYGPPGIEDLALSETTVDGPSVLIAEGEELAHLAGNSLGSHSGCLPVGT